MCSGIVGQSDDRKGTRSRSRVVVCSGGPLYDARAGLALMAVANAKVLGSSR